MKKLIEITGVNTIKPETRETVDDLKELHYKANELLFSYNYTNINLKMAEALKKQFTKIGESIKDLDLHFKPKVNQKKNEILVILRTIVKAITNYINDYDDRDDLKGAQAVINYQVAQYIKGKENNATEEEIIKQLKRNKIIHTCYIKGNDNIKSDTFIKMQQELINKLTNKYQID